MSVLQPNIRQQTTIHIDYNTSNKSFLDMHYYLKDKGISNNVFFLQIINKELIGVNPRDPKLNARAKNLIMKECIQNYWYFLREVIRIPDQGGSVGSGKMYELTRGNLALNYGFIRNWNMFLELPRQTGKTISAICRYVWLFNFGTTMSEFMFMNKKHDDSKLNLARFKEIRAALPVYLVMDSAYGDKKLKPKDSVETLEHPINGNKIKTMASAKNKIHANSLGRGCTQPIQWYDEHAFTPHIGIVYSSATPAFKTASMNAIKNRAPYGILITTTPGDMNTDEGQESFNVRNAATKFNEAFYDKSDSAMTELIMKNTDSPFIHMRFTYQQMGRDEVWFKEICVLMQKKWSDIRREVLLEWSTVADNSPFAKEDLNIVQTLLKEPIASIFLGGSGNFQMDIYDNINPMNPPIVGVDVSGGYKRDSSAITVIDSLTTKIVATLNCNYISTDDLAYCLYELATKYMPNCVINVERNGGFGASVLSKLMKTGVKKNLYYEIKDKVIEERVSDTGFTTKSTKRMKIYGLDSSKAVRDNLMEILRERMEYHKDKFIARPIFQELEMLEVKRTGKIEHSTNGHDDQIFSYLMALYVWYEGKNIAERFGIYKRAIKSDADIEEGWDTIEGRYANNCAIEIMSDEDTADMVNNQLAFLKTNTKMYEQHLIDEFNKDQEALTQLMRTSPIAREAFQSQYHMKMDIGNTGLVTLPQSIFDPDIYN